MFYTSTFQKQTRNTLICLHVHSLLLLFCDRNLNESKNILTDKKSVRRRKRRVSVCDE